MNRLFSFYWKGPTNQSSANTPPLTTNHKSPKMLHSLPYFGRCLVHWYSSKYSLSFMTILIQHTLRRDQRSLPEVAPFPGRFHRFLWWCALALVEHIVQR